MFVALQARIAARLPKGRVARGIITLVSGTAVAQIVTICAMPIVTRVYTPAEIGVISLFLSFFGFWAGTLSLRYEYALLIAESDTQSHYVHRLAVILVLVMSVLGLPILWALQHASVLGFELLPNWAPLAVVPILMGYGVFMAYRSWALRAGMVKEITGAAIARSSANAGARIALGVLGAGVAGLFAAELAGAWGAMLRLSRRVRAHFAPSQPARIGFRELLQSGRAFIKFPVFETPSAWIDLLGLTLPLPIVATLHGATAAGWFGLARMIVGIPNSQIGSAVADIFQMELANALRSDDHSRARTLFYTLLRKLALIGLVPMFVVMVLAPSLVPWIFGGRWHEAGIAAVCIAPWLYAALVISPLSRTLSVMQAQEYKLVYDVCAVLLVVAAFFVAKHGGYSFVESVMAISAAGFVGYIIYAGVLIVVVERRLGCKVVK
ncbi:MAG: hypothetical protein EPN34_04780 [Burkholderiaceae bacterium]|nr:MAG: hypothetical protein EPN34_04780 [Burkholderiaceae bacterium]